MSSIKIPFYLRLEKEIWNMCIGILIGGIVAFSFYQTRSTIIDASLRCCLPNYEYQRYLNKLYLYSLLKGFIMIRCGFLIGFGSWCRRLYLLIGFQVSSDLCCDLFVSIWLVGKFILPFILSLKNYLICKLKIKKDWASFSSRHVNESELV
jgi:hypothetical protein